MRERWDRMACWALGLTPGDVRPRPKGVTVSPEPR